MGRTARRVSRRNSGINPVVFAALGVPVAAAVGGYVFGMHSCGRLIESLVAAQHLLVWAAVVFVATWLTVCVIRGFAHACLETAAKQRLKRQYLLQGYRLVDGVVYQHGEKVA